MVLEGVNFKKELYFAIVLDRASGGPALVASPMGGMDIEEVAEKHPDQIYTVCLFPLYSSFLTLSSFFAHCQEPIPIKTGLTDEIASRAATKLGFEEGTPAFDDAITQMKNLYKLLIKEDGTLVEINPLILHSENGKIYCVDGKLNFDDNAEFRHKDLFAMRDFTMEDPREVAASKVNLNYVGMDVCSFSTMSTSLVSHIGWAAFLTVFFSFVFAWRVVAFGSIFVLCIIVSLFLCLCYFPLRRFCIGASLFLYLCSSYFMFSLFIGLLPCFVSAPPCREPSGAWSTALVLPCMFDVTICLSLLSSFTCSILLSCCYFPHICI